MRFKVYQRTGAPKFLSRYRPLHCNITFFLDVGLGEAGTVVRVKLGIQTRLGAN